MAFPKERKEILTLESNTGDEGRSAESTPGGKEVAPTKTGDKDGKENSPRNSAVRKTSPTNSAAAGSDGGSPVYIACVEKGQTCLYTMPCNQLCLLPLRLLWQFQNFS